MASLRKAKKLAKKLGIEFIDPTKEKKRLLRTLKVQVKETNKRLRQLDRKGFYNTFSSRKLFDRLDSGKINALEKLGEKVIGVKIKKNINITEINAILRATSNFLKSNTSTPFKTRQVLKKTKDSMFKTLKIKDDSLTMEDIEDYYNMLGDRDFDYFNEKIGASEMWAVIDDAIEAGDDKNQFLKRMSSLISLNDSDIVRKAINLFNKYV